jgi:hypothetical protein
MHKLISSLLAVLASGCAGNAAALSIVTVDGREWLQTAESMGQRNQG